MPKKSRLKLIALPLSSETPGQHLARVRKERGYRSSSRSALA
jgi:hypothetical protein